MKHHRIRLFCLPYAGGNIYSYRKLSDFLADEIAFMPLELPGHGKRMKETLLTDTQAMTADLSQQLTPEHSAPYAIYGHSMGALLGYLLVCALQRKQRPLPVHLFVSGRQSPAMANHGKRVHHLPDDEFLQKVREYGGIPDAIAREHELIALFLPIFRADFRALDEYTYTENILSSVPITVMTGASENIAYKEAAHWQQLTTATTVFHEFSGDHFFIFDHLPAIGEIISQTLKPPFQNSHFE